MSDLVKMIQEADRNERPHPLTTVHGPRAVQPIYAISKHELSELTSRIEALEAENERLRMYLSRWTTAHLHDEAYRADLRQETRAALPHP